MPQGVPAAQTSALDGRDEALKENIRQYHRMVESVGDGVMVLDADQVIVFANQALAEMLGHPATALVGLPLSSLVAGENRDEPRPLRPRLSISEESELCLRAADGSVRWVIARSIPLFDAEGQYCGVRARVIDVTGLRQAEAEVLRLREQLATGSALLEQRTAEQSQMAEFVATVSHEFRTPLTSVRGYLDLMLADPDLSLDQRERYLHRLLANAEHLSSLLNQLLDLSQISEGQIALTVRPVSIRGVVDQLQAAMAPQFQERAIDLLVAQPGDQIPLVVVTDEECLIRILTNLLSNSCKYTPAGGIVTLSIGSDANAIVFSVADTGVGIPANEQGRIFSRFYRGSNTRRLGSRGTGLGLAITKSLVELLGGEIDFTSEEGVGTVFQFSLPTQPTA
jgi:PAS domain S-box-containing protein